jgi:hypothetical protein
MRCLLSITHKVDQPQGPEKGERRVLRGSSWPYLHVGTRCAVRLRLAPDRWV